MSENPFRSDEQLREYLTGVGSIENGQDLMEWRISFLKVYEKYLDPDGVLNAKDAESRLITKLQTLAKVSMKVHSLAQTGHITQEQVTADGRRFLAKWTDEMKTVETAVGMFCPKTSADEEVVGYDKYELGAILIQDGFQVYQTMLSNRDFISELKDGYLVDVLDSNTLSIIDYYSRGMQAFVDIMSDLGLWKLMKQCVDIYKEEPRPDPGSEPELFVEAQEDRVEVHSSHGQGPNGVNKRTGGKVKKEKGKKSKSKKSPGKPGRKAGGGKADEEFEYKDKSEEEEEEEPPPTDGQGGEPTKLIYFDPKTGSLGLLDRAKCETESTLFFAGDSGGEPQNLGVIESPGEKENLNWLLKKLEKKEKPKDGAWLENIKKEKAKGGGGKRASVRVTKEPASPRRSSSGKRSSTKSRSSKRGSSISLLDSSCSSLNSTSSSSSPKNTGFKSPLSGSSSSRRSSSRKSAVEDYQGLYARQSIRPDNGGWEKIQPLAEEDEDAA